MIFSYGMAMNKICLKSIIRWRVNYMWYVMLKSLVNSGDFLICVGVEGGLI